MTPNTTPRGPSPPWPDDEIEELVEGETYERTHPVTGETVTVEILSIDGDGPGVVIQHRTV